MRVDLEGPYALEVGDTFLRCSDGLSGQVKDEEIGAILSALAPAEAGQVLIDLAKGDQALHLENETAQQDAGGGGRGLVIIRKAGEIEPHGRQE